MVNKFLFLLVWVLAAVSATARNRQLFDSGWLFCLNSTDTTLYRSNAPDGAWRQLDLPHDWAIEGNFAASNPSGATGGALPGGVGWYRKHFKAQLVRGERLFVDFDGVYMNATVWINGHRLGTRPYGYSSFRYDITPFVNGGDNVMAVKVDNSEQPNSRWYSGCGIYRHVWITRTSQLHIAHWGAHVVSDGNGNVMVNLTLEGLEGERPAIRNTILDSKGRIVARKENGSTQQRLRVKNPKLWSLSSPYTYVVKSEVIVGGETVDEVCTTTGFRSFCFDAKTGFSLNGESVKLNGVCEHHDFGCLGAALNEDAMHRKLQRLKAMGVNALRCTHNPPAPELLNMCDTMGFVVMDECFDMWRRKKTAHDYAQYFDEWHERDLGDMVLRDRNHPSVFIWSIGNEVLEQQSTASADELTLEQANIILNLRQDTAKAATDTEVSPNAMLTRHLVGIVKNLDTSRPVTAGCNFTSAENNLFKSGALDIIGFNYQHYLAKDVPNRFPGKPFLFTESVSALATRGYYRMPSGKAYVWPDSWTLQFSDPSMMCSSYDNCYVPWGSSHEQTWDVVKHTPWCAGQFIWTGFDYIGEPTPYGFPARSSYFGIIDLAGFPKDAYYMYQSEWTSRTVLHLLPHWNWLPGQDVDVWCYYNNADEVELFLNGKSLGTRRKTDSHQYHLVWNVPFEAGELKAVSRKADGSVVATQTVHTAGSAYGLRLTKDYDGEKTLFVAVEVVDKDGNLCPLADDDIKFTVLGGRIIGVDNGSQFSMERFQSDHRKAFFGKALVVISKEAGEIKVKAESPMLKAAEVIF